MKREEKIKKQRLGLRMTQIRGNKRMDMIAKTQEDKEHGGKILNM